ncbi:unnamed protein product [Gongylonema pulchrum]|uniref:Ammonium_transp domain-containing protein n=1 Tax=Gongylonema pulchrum TaxID=637853 RepID=A0A183F0A3_9BILA|nr:unnamed protein product [Gongylonema pulchrum]
MEKIRKQGTPGAFYIASATLAQAIVAVIAMLGMRIYAKIARFIVIFPLICFTACTIYAMCYAGLWNTIGSIAEGFSPNRQEFMSIESWSVAALHVCFSHCFLLLISSPMM